MLGVCAADTQLRDGNQRRMARSLRATFFLSPFNGALSSHARVNSLEPSKSGILTAATMDGANSAVLHLRRRVTFVPADSPNKRTCHKVAGKRIRGK